MQNFEAVNVVIDFLKKKFNFKACPEIAVISGTGLGALSALLSDYQSINFEDISDFPYSTVESHAGRFLFGYIGNKFIVIQEGRCHLYEGYAADEVCFGVRVMAGFGVKTLIISNAAGALNPYWDTGDLMLICDHINYTGKSPLTGKNYDEWGLRFPDMTNAYDYELRKLSLKVAAELKIRLECGVYLGLFGPQLETPAETRVFRSSGADAIGMSTVLEVIAARHLGLKVIGISCLTNKNLPDCMEEIILEDIIDSAVKSGDKLLRLVHGIILEL